MGGQSKELTICPKCGQSGYWIVEPEWKKIKHRKYKDRPLFYYLYKKEGARILQKALERYNIRPLPYEGQKLWKYLKDHFTEDELRNHPQKQYLLRYKNLIIHALYRKVDRIAKAKNVKVPFIRVRFGHYDSAYFKRKGHAKRCNIKRIVGAWRWYSRQGRVIEKKSLSNICDRLGIQNPSNSLLEKIGKALNRL